MRQLPVVLTALNGIETDTTSEPIDISNTRKISLLVTGANFANRSVSLSTTVSLDRTTFVPYNMLVNNLTKLNSEQETYTQAITLGHSGSELAFFSHLGFLEMKVVADVSDSGLFFSGSVSPSVSGSASPSVSLSKSPSVSPSISPSVSPTHSLSPSVSPSASPSVSLSVSPSISPSISTSRSPSA